jgi:hypothetical protein
MVPFYALYDQYYLRYQRFGNYLKSLKKSNRSSPRKSPLRSSPSYDEKYPPLEDVDELNQNDPLLFKQFNQTDRDNLKKNISKSVQSFHNSIINAQNT